MKNGENPDQKVGTINDNYLVEAIQKGVVKV